MTDPQTPLTEAERLGNAIANGFVHFHEPVVEGSITRFSTDSCPLCNVWEFIDAIEAEAAAAEREKLRPSPPSTPASWAERRMTDGSLAGHLAVFLIAFVVSFVLIFAILRRMR